MYGKLKDPEKYGAWTRAIKSWLKKAKEWLVTNAKAFWNASPFNICCKRRNCKAIKGELQRRR